MKSETRGEFARSIALRAGELIKSADPNKDVLEKGGRGNYVTGADLASEKLVMNAIRKAYPADGILSEETSADIGNVSLERGLWVIDPLDGTNNFRFSRNYSAVSIGYVEKGVVKLGVAYDPFRQELYYAEHKNGVTLNEKPIQVGSAATLEKATVATDNSYDHNSTRKNLETLLKIKKTPWTLMKGSAVLTLCDVATGRVDFYFHCRLNPWDIAAALLIVQEAGGQAIDFDGKEATFKSPGIAAGNFELVSEFRELIKA